MDVIVVGAHDLLKGVQNIFLEKDLVNVFQKLIDI